jgi:hypothetical protein
VENRKKYPADYDSSSDYEVKKLGEVVKQMDDLKKSSFQASQNHTSLIK